MSAKLQMDKLKLSDHATAHEQGQQGIVLVACGSFNPPTIMHIQMFHLAAEELSKV